MKDNTVFERLSAELTRDERERLLSSLREGREEALAPVSGPGEAPPPPIEEQVKALGLFGRFLIFLQQIFSGRSREELLLRRTLTTMRQGLRKPPLPGVDPVRRLFTEPFAEVLEEARKSQSGAAPLLEAAAMNREELVIRLAALECPVLNRELLLCTSRSAVEEADERNERVLRSNLTRSVEERLQEISSASAARIRLSLAQVDQLNDIAQFPFSSLVGSFSGEADAGGRTCPFDYVARLIERLVSRLACLSGPLEQTALETIVLIAHRRDNYASQDTYQDALVEGFRTLTGAIAVVRDLSHRYPLLTLVRIMREEPWWQPPASEHTGNDWLSIYRASLGARIAAEVLRVSLRRQVEDKLASLEDVIGNSVQPMANLPEDIRRFYSAMVLRSFAEHYLPETLPPLKLILTGADFYKSSNRAQYNDAFNDYEKIPREIKTFEKTLSPDGDWGTVLHGNGTEEQRRTMIARVEEELQRLAASARVTLETLSNLLGGILYAKPGSSYDSIANYGQIGGRRNSELIEEIRLVHTGLHSIAAILNEVPALEERAGENGIILRQID